MYLEVLIDGVWLRTGTHTRSQDGAILMPPASSFHSPEWAMFLHYPQADLSWLTVRVTAGPLTAPRRFVGDPSEVDRVLQDYGASLDRMKPGNAQPDFASKTNFQCGVVRRGEPLTLEFGVNSDLKLFLKYVRENLGEGQSELNVTIRGMMLQWKNPAAREQAPFEIRVTMRPLSALVEFSGVLAMDLGSTSSTIAALTTGWQRTSEVLILSNDGGDKSRLGTDRESASIPSHVRFDEIVTWKTDTGAAPYAGIRKLPSMRRDDLPLAVRWTVGALADTASDRGGLVVGMKRLLSSGKPEQTTDLSIPHNRQFTENPDRRTETIAVLNRFPAELMACRLMQWFSRASLLNGTPAGIPMRVALTYPTTWSPAEIDQLRRAVYRAWLRMRHRAQESGADQPAPDGDPRMESIEERIQRQIQRPEIVAPREAPLIPLMLDEASAASFYFLYRRILESPGGLPSFRYNYPSGLNMILYDCGGGTTDIALVRAEADPSQDRVLNIQVRSRSGVRHFGGDDITAAICRLLKAKLARRVLEETATGTGLPPEPPVPANVASIPARLAARASVEEFIRKMGEFDREGPTGPVVPTAWLGRGLSDEKTRERMDNMAVLWRWAEAFKRRLSSLPEPVVPATPPAGSKPDPVRAFFSDREIGIRITPTSSQLAAALLQARKGNPAQEKALGEYLESKVSISRWEVDALIGSQVSRTVRNCNWLIEEQLVEANQTARPPRPDEELHWVVVTGNASRYPLIQEMLRERLDTDDLTRPGRMEVDLHNMKNAVAKGAALWLSTLVSRGNVRIHTDSNLSECLPCDIGYLNVTNNLRDKLYAVQSPFETLAEKTVLQVGLGGENARTQAFSLERRFPGDGVGHNPAEDGPPTDLDLNRGWSPFVTFHFRDPIVGDLAVNYDRDKHAFTVRDSAGNEGVPRETESGNIHKSPMQRGDI